MSENTVRALQEATRWRGRNVTYWGGNIERLLPMLPEFSLEDFVAGANSAPNPYLKAVVRRPKTQIDKVIAVGTVSNAYALVQHKYVVQRCLDGISMADVDPKELDCEIGLTEFGEWMDLRFYFPQRFDHIPSDGYPLSLRLECFNSVEGSNSLVILLGWFRYVCSNGMVVGETRIDLRQLHNNTLDLNRIPFDIDSAMHKIEQERKRLETWSCQALDWGHFEKWADGAVSTAWGKRAALRVFHICQSGWDVETDDHFAPGKATEKPVRRLALVPGATIPASTLYDVSQALSFVATGRANAEIRLEWQSDISQLVEKLATAK
jgi:hypothetical protein